MRNVVGTTDSQSEWIGFGKSLLRFGRQWLDGCGLLKPDVAIELVRHVGKVPNISETKFAEIAEITKSGCPVSKVLNAKISLVAKLSN